MIQFSSGGSGGDHCGPQGGKEEVLKADDGIVHQNYDTTEQGSPPNDSVVVSIRSNEEDVELERQATGTDDAERISTVMPNSNACSHLSNARSLHRPVLPQPTELCATENFATLHDNSMVCRNVDPNSSNDIREVSTSRADESGSKKCCSASGWRRTVHRGQEPVKRFLTDRMAVPAAKHPVLCLTGITVLSFLLFAAGVCTNFRIESNEIALWTPRGSQPEQDGHWVDSVFEKLQKQQAASNRSLSSDSGATKTEHGRYVALLVHANGDNVLTVDGSLHNFEALDRVRSVAGYNELCAKFGDSPCPTAELEFICFLYNIDPNSTNVCPIGGVSAYWFHNTTIFEGEVKTNGQVHDRLSLNIFPGDDVSFDVTEYLGYPVYETNPTTGEKVLVGAKSFLTGLSLPGLKHGDTALQDRMVEEIVQLQKEWKANGDSFHVSIMSSHSFTAEFTRGIYTDLPLLPVVAILMAGFTAFVFWKRGDWLHSRTMVGVGAVFCVVMSLMSGYGLMFCFGVPFTNLTLAMLYVVFGLGLDDTFVLYSVYVRTNPADSSVERIRATFDEAAISIFMTTFTNEVSFFFGFFSPIPAIRWVCVSWQCCHSCCCCGFEITGCLCTSNRRFLICSKRFTHLPRLASTLSSKSHSLLLFYRSTRRESKRNEEIG